MVRALDALGFGLVADGLLQSTMALRRSTADVSLQKVPFRRNAIDELVIRCRQKSRRYGDEEFESTGGIERERVVVGDVAGEVVGKIERGAGVAVVRTHVRYHVVSA